MKLVLSFEVLFLRAHIDSNVFVQTLIYDDLVIEKAPSIGCYACGFLNGDSHKP